MLLLADSGSTKTDWRIVKPSGLTILEFKTQGINPYFKSPEQIKRELKKQVLNPIEGLSQVIFYGAGCGHPKKASELALVLDEVFPAESSAMVQGDILGAARSLFQNRPGIPCILGTGANSCVYDGEKIIGTVPSLGFILGDYGSGAVLGRDFVQQLLSEKLSPELTARFFEKFALDRVAILDRIYKQSHPNRFLASLIPFIHSEKSDEEVQVLIKASFSKFFEFYINPYRQKGVDFPISFAGSVAYHFQEFLQEVANDLGEEILEIRPKPLDGLVKYHCA